MKRSVRRDGSKASGFLLGAGLMLFGLSSTYFVLQDSPELSSAPPTLAAEPHEVANTMLVSTPLEQGIPAVQELPPVTVPSPQAVAPVTAKKSNTPKKTTSSEAPPATPKTSGKQPKAAAGDSGEEAVKPVAVTKSTTVKESFKPTNAAVKVIDEAEEDASSKKELSAKPSPAKPKADTNAPVPVKAEVVGEKPFVPKVLMATENKAWVQTDPLKTVIVEKNQSIPGLGEFKGADGNVAKFDGKAIPIESESKKESDK